MSLVYMAGLWSLLVLVPSPFFATDKVSTVQPKASASQKEVPADYVLGPDDQITIQVLGVEELSAKPIGVDTGGYIDLPLVGRVKASGLTLEQLKSELTTRLKVYVKQPDVAISVTEFRSQPVSVLGLVGASGVHQLQGRKTLMEVISLAGGVRPEAGPVAQITRRIEYGEIPIPGASLDPSGQFSVAQVQLKAIMDGRSPEQNILVRPHDVISVPKADIVYVIGMVKKTGGFVINDRRKTTLIEVLAMAEGMLPEANHKKAELLRRTADQEERSKIALNIEKIMTGKEKDIAMQPEDIVVISPSVTKSIQRKVAETAVSVVTSLAIYGALY